ncbi:hypothetical protein SPI_09311 [Niveomyces insectorum RCEF 264]|uniref:Uncharacterized protein n=1 Tax=Niveomyces insectorum RCEF 264 TaxID=1081102 RepID=A0A167LWL2_9HYPO|nr:hypothetical protein SPI_09311 [Niveomyces insectorum RCEF 264]
MAHIIEQHLEHIQKLEEEIGSKIADINSLKQELETTLSIVEGVPDDLMELMSRSASISTIIRDISEPNSIDFSKTQKGGQIQAAKDNIKKQEEKLRELKQEKKDWEEILENERKNLDH